MSVITPLSLAWILFIISEALAVLIMKSMHDWNNHANYANIYIYTERNRKYNWQTHWVSMTLGLVIINAHGMVFFRLLPKVKTKLLKFCHIATYAMVACFVVYGYYLMHKEMLDICGAVPNRYGFHEYHLHIYMGYITMLMLLVQIVSGLLVYVMPCSNQRMRKRFASFHNFVGLKIFWFTIITCIEHIQYLYYLRDYAYTQNKDFFITSLAMLLYGLVINCIVLNPYLEWRLVGRL